MYGHLNVAVTIIHVRLSKTHMSSDHSFLCTPVVLHDDEYKNPKEALISNRVLK